LKMDTRHPKKLLFVCSVNRMRSYTAEKIYQKLDRYQVRSRGTESGARVRIAEGDIGWADIIFTMEKRHTNRIRAKFKEKIKGKRIVTLFIDDIYDAMDPALIELLKSKLSAYVHVP